MNDHDTDTMLDERLRGLDAATGPDAAQRVRAQALLDSLVEPPSPASVRPLRRRSHRWVWFVGAAAALAVGGMLLPGALAPSPAFASWTEKPTKASEADVAAATKGCAEALQRLDDRKVPGVEPGMQPTVTGEPRLLLSEQRGDNILVAMVTANTAQISCLSRAAEPGKIVGTAASLPTADATVEALAPDQIVTGGPSVQGEGKEGFAVLLGRVGSQVREVTARSEGRTTQATVSDGWFAAWWPTGPVGPTTGMDTTITATLEDGRTIQPETMLGKLPGAREIGRISQSFGVSLDGGGAMNSVEGVAGAEVAEVLVTVDRRVLTAKVVNGGFQVSWQGELQPQRTLGKDTVAVQLPEREISYTITLKDGTVLHDVKPVR